MNNFQENVNTKTNRAYKKWITLTIIFSIVKVKLLFKKVFISVLIILRILFIIGKYISKLSPSVDVNKNSKIYFLIQWESGQDVHKEKKKLLKVVA